MFTRNLQIFYQNASSMAWLTNTLEISTLSTFLSGINCSVCYLVSLLAGTIWEILWLVLNLTNPSIIILDLEKEPQYPILPMLMRNVIVDFLRNMPSISSIKHGNPRLFIRIFNWILMEIFMPSILQPLIYVWTCFGGPSSVKRRVVLNCIHCMTLKPPSLVISMYRPHLYMM